MNIAKNMEAIFIVAVALSAGTGLATAAVPAHRAAAHLVHSHATVNADHATIPVVTISAKRLTAAEKAALAD